MRSKLPIRLAAAYSNPAVLDLGGSVDAVAGLVAKALKPGEIEAHHLAAALHDLAGDQHRVDILRAHIGHDRADGVIKRHDVETVGVQQDNVGLLAGRQRADLAVEAVRPPPSIVANSSTSRTVR